jgi:hypothetical protein
MDEQNRQDRNAAQTIKDWQSDRMILLYRVAECQRHLHRFPLTTPSCLARLALRGVDSSLFYLSGEGRIILIIWSHQRSSSA